MRFGYYYFCVDIIWAYSSVVERVHGMDEVGVRLSVGPPNKLFILNFLFCVFSSVVERSVHIGKAVGPIPTRRTRFLKNKPNSWAYSKVVLRGIRIAEARVRFSLGPPFI